MLDNPLLDVAMQYGAAYAHRALPAAPVVRNYGADDNASAAVSFQQAAKFGGLSASVVLCGALMGFAFDEYFSAKAKTPKGWGPVVGAVAGVAATNAIAGLSQGVPAAAGYALGGAGALVPLGVAAYALDKSTEDKTTVKVLAVLAGLSVVTGVVRGVMRSE